MAHEIFKEDALTLRLFDTDAEVRLEWHGQSMAREPTKFLLPILSRALDRGLQLEKPLVIDFSRLEYLNSSTLTPVIRILEQARRGHSRVHVVYNRALKWQSLSFTGLDVFRTPDARIDVRGI